MKNTNNIIDRLGISLLQFFGGSRFVYASFIIIAVYAVIFIFRTIVNIDGVNYFTLFDDGMISMRYASNFSIGHGLVWNIGEKVEGYTNPLWTIFMSVVITGFGKHDAPLIIQIAGFSFMLASIFLSFVTVRMFVLSERDENYMMREHALAVSTFSVLFLLGTFYPLYYWSLMGMEVSVLSLFTAAAALALISSAIHESRRTLAFSSVIILMGLSYFVRPDGFIVLTPILLVTGFWSWKSNKRKTLLLGASIGITFLVLALLHYLWRIEYYGQSMPNTYVLKVTGYDFSLRITNGLKFVSKYLLLNSLLIALGVFLLFRRLKGNAVVLTLMSGFVLSIVYQIYVGGDPWDYWRQLVPGTILLFIALSVGYAKIISKIRRNTGQAFFTFAVVLLLSSTIANSIFGPQVLFFKRPHTVSTMGEMIKTANALNRVLEPQATVLSFWAGTIPYYWPGTALDPLGKTDPGIARLPVDTKVAWGRMSGVPGHAKHNLDYSILQRQPDYIQRWEWYSRDLTDDIRDMYVLVEYEGINLCLRRNSEYVKWSLVNTVGPCLIRPV